MAQRHRGLEASAAYRRHVQPFDFQSGICCTVTGPRLVSPGVYTARIRAQTLPLEFLCLLSAHCSGNRCQGLPLRRTVDGTRSRPSTVAPGSCTCWVLPLAPPSPPPDAGVPSPAEQSWQMPAEVGWRGGGPHVHPDLAVMLALHLRQQGGTATSRRPWQEHACIPTFTTLAVYDVPSHPHVLCPPALCR